MVMHASWTLSLPYFRPDANVNTLFQTRLYPEKGLICVHIWDGLQISDFNWICTSQEMIKKVPLKIVPTADQSAQTIV